MTKQSDIEMVAKARAWAVKAHAGQKDKAGKDYFKAHVTVVAEGVKGDPIAEAVAFLHDTVEDTSVTIEDIRTGFPKEVADTVSTLTHSKGISYAEYLWYIQQNSIAVKVKLSDLRSNMDLTRLPHTPTERDLERTRKYKRAYTILSSREGISAVNPYALYDYLLANNWSVKRKSTRTPVLETTDGSAEIKEVKIPKEKRPVLVSKPGATPKKVNVKTYNVGFVIGKSFEMQLVSGAEYQKSTATGTGRTVRPHVRRAHWHHYWVGEGRTRLEVRWIEPTFVLPEGKREIKIATVRRVMGT